jgi:hypothetical protein
MRSYSDIAKLPDSMKLKPDGADSWALYFVGPRAEIARAVSTDVLTRPQLIVQTALGLMITYANCNNGDLSVAGIGNFKDYDQDDWRTDMTIRTGCDKLWWTKVKNPGWPSPIFSIRPGELGIHFRSLDSWYLDRAPDNPPWQ